MFQRPIGFNLIPQIGSFKEQGGEGDGYTSEELKMVRETRKILGLPELAVNATCVRVPVADCHSESITCEFDRAITPAEARAALAAFPGLAVVDDPAAGEWPTPLDCAGDDRDVRRAHSQRPVRTRGGCPSGASRTTSAKGPRPNAVQIAELLANN